MHLLGVVRKETLSCPAIKWIAINTMCTQLVGRLAPETMETTILRLKHQPVTSIVCDAKTRQCIADLGKWIARRHDLRTDRKGFANMRAQIGFRSRRVRVWWNVYSHTLVREGGFDGGDCSISIKHVGYVTRDMGDA